MVFLDPKEKLAPKAQPDIQGAQDHKAPRETAACPDYRDYKDPLDQEDPEAHRVKRARRERGAAMVKWVRWAPLDIQAHRGVQESWVLRACLARKVRLASKDGLVTRDQLGCPDSLDHRASKVCRVLRAMQVLWVPLENVANVVKLGHLESVGRRDRGDRKGHLGHRV